MAVVPQIFNGLFGDRSQVDFVPTCGFGKGNNNLVPEIQRMKNAPKFFGYPLDYSTRRGVMPCDTSLVHKVIRREPLPDSGGIQPIIGIGRGGADGLQVGYHKTPRNLPVMKKPNIYALDKPCPLGQPKSWQ